LRRIQTTRPWGRGHGCRGCGKRSWSTSPTAPLANSGCEAREEYARKRRSELSAALALAGLSPEQARQLGCVDQEAALNLAPLARLLAALLKELRPEVLLTHPYEGGHPDHDATAFIASAACRLLQREGETPPLLVEMTSYHNSPSGLCPEEFLPHPDVAVVTRVLSPEEREFKRRLVNCFPTQWGTLQYFPLEKECFRPAPPYDFTRAPHEGRLFYEGFEWGMTGERFRALAEEALRELGIGRG